MIIACPACDTRFQVDDAALRAGGRRLRCASCRHVWQFTPERIEPVAFPDPPAVDAVLQSEEPHREAAPGPAAPLTAERLSAVPFVAPERIEPRIEEPLSEPLANPSAEPRLELSAPEASRDGPSGETEPAVSPRPSGTLRPAPGRRRWPLVGGLALATLAAAAVLVAVFAPDQVMALWPATARLYAMADLVTPPGDGLKVTLQPSRTADALVVDGDIVNSAAVPRPIPRLRLTLRDGNKADLTSQIIDPPVPRLPPGASVHFNAVFEHPSMAATKVDATFATD